MRCKRNISKPNLLNSIKLKQLNKLEELFKNKFLNDFKSKGVMCRNKKQTLGLMFATLNIGLIFASSIEAQALTYTGWSEWSATAPGNTYGRVVEAQTQYMYRDKEFTNQPTSSYSGWTLTGYKYDIVSDWKTQSILAHDSCSIGATNNTSYVTGNTGSIAVARTTYELSGYWYWDAQSNAGWNMFASPSGTYETHCGKKVRYKYEANNGSGMVTYAHITQTRTVTPMWEFWRWQNNGAWTYQWSQPASQNHREIQSRTMYRYKDLIDTTAPSIGLSGNPTGWTKNDVTLTVTASDSEAGVKSITLPNGSVVNSSSASYTVSSNGNYTFKVTDNLGNVASQTLSVTKIDKTTPTYTSAEIKNITTDGFDVYVYGVSDGQSGMKVVRFPTWTSANGQDDLAGDWNSDSNTSVKGEDLGNGTYKFRVNRSEHNNEFGEYITHIYMYDNVGNYSSTGVSYNVKDITNPTLSITGNPTSWTKDNVTLTVTGADYGTGVKSITLPNGTVVNSSSTTYTVSANGNYTFKVTDNSGNEVSQTVSVTKIDKTSPTLAVAGNPSSWTKDDVTLSITGADSQSGVSSITLPNGQVVSGSKTTYTISANGNYTFKVTDNAGNVLTHNVSVTKIDKTNPTVTVAGNPTAWTKNDVTLTVTGADSQSGVKSITKPDGTVVTGSSTTYTVSSNGTYTFKVTDNAGNILTHNVSVTKIDKAGPVISQSLTPNTWTNGNVTITLTVTDAGAGLKEIHMPNGTVVSNSTASYTVSKNGAYYFKAVDNLGNETVLPILVTNIDVKAPSLNINNNQNWTNQDVQINITGTD
ncbi:GBS Bsp-like repeat-containing protein [Clostridium disporicum]|uniref:GBS Bsp-like repeat-containing protein n=1 Tax=Clostridium disporicum TaxID=84024 RepID=UPI0034A1981D